MNDNYKQKNTTETNIHLKNIDISFNKTSTRWSFMVNQVHYQDNDGINIPRILWEKSESSNNVAY